MAVIKRVLCRERLRRVPEQFSWLDHRLVRDRHLARCSMVLVTVYQNDIDATTISRTGQETPTDASLRSIIAYAHGLGLKVMLKPQLDLLRDPSHWRGQIGPHFTGAAWAAWFASYQEQIVHYATLAAGAPCTSSWGRARAACPYRSARARYPASRR